MSSLHFIDKTTGTPYNAGGKPIASGISMVVKDLKIPEGYALSFHDCITMEIGPLRPILIEHKDGKALISYCPSGGYALVSVEIESSTTEAFIALRKAVLSRLGGEVVIFSPQVETPSLLHIVKGDLVRLRQWIKGCAHTLRQCAGIKLLSR